MDTGTTTMTEQQIADLFSNEFSDMKSRVRERQPYLPRIMLTVFRTENKKAKGVSIGDWYLIDSNTPQGESPKYKNLGPSIEFTVLTDSMNLSFYNDDEKRTTVETTEFQNYSSDPVFLLDSRRGPTHIAAIAPYSGNAVQTISNIRKGPQWPHKASKSGEAVSALSTSYNVYVALPDGTTAILCNTKRGHFGTDEKGETCGFENVAPDSYIRARANCHEQTPGITLAHRWRASSVPVSAEDDDIRPAFFILGVRDPKEVSATREAANNLQKYLQARWADRIGYAWRNTSPADRDRLVCAYADVRTLLDSFDGHDVAAQIILGKKAAPALLSEAEPNYEKEETKSKMENRKAIIDLEQELEDEKIAPPEEMYSSEIKAEDLPF